MVSGVVPRLKETKMVSGVGELSASAYPPYGIRVSSTLHLVPRLRGGMLTDGDGAPAPATATTSAVSVKAPAFIPSNPNTWFVLLEAQFQINVQTTRFYHALANLPVDTVCNLEENVLEAANYEQLKDAVNKCHEQSKGQLFESFLRDTPLTGKPSQHLLRCGRWRRRWGSTTTWCGTASN